MKDFDFRPYVVSVIVSVGAYYIGRSTDDDHVAAKKAAEATAAEVTRRTEKTEVDVGALRSEVNRFYLEFKQYAVENTLRDEARDEKITKIVDILNGQHSRQRRLIYFPGVVAASDSTAYPVDTVKVNFLVRR